MHLVEYHRDLKHVRNSATKVHHRWGELSSFSCQVPDSTGENGTLESGVEHPAFFGCSGESPVLVVASALYWKLKGYEVEHCPALKKVICGW
jgi:hypothetical protein